MLNVFISIYITIEYLNKKYIRRMQLMFAT